MSDKKYYLGKIVFSKDDAEMEEEWNVLYSTAKEPQEVLDLIAKHFYDDGIEEEPVKDKNDWWVFADGNMSQAYSYHIIKEATYDDLQGKIHTENSYSGGTDDE
jgi:hypothetical protein